MMLFDKLFGKKDRGWKNNKNKRKKKDLINTFIEAISNSQWREAIEHGEELALILKNTGERAEEFACHLSLGSAYANIGDFKKAIEHSEKSLEITKDIGDRGGEYKCYSNLGNAYRGLGDFKKAIECHEKSLEITKDVGDRAGESKGYMELGASYYDLEDFNKAIEFWKKSLEIDKDVGDRAGESKGYMKLGAAYYDLGNFNKAIEFWKKSLEIDKDIGDRAGESAGYTNLGAAYYDLEDFNKAIEYYEESLEIDKDVGDRAGESAGYTKLGAGYHNLGNFKKAIECHEKSLKINKDIGDRAGESAGYTNLGVAYDNLGNFKKAIECHEKGLEIAKEIGDKGGESKYYTNLGAAYQGSGDFKKAIEYLEKSLEIDEYIDNRKGKSASYGELGNAYLGLGDFEKAGGLYQKSLKINKEIGDRAGEASCYSALGNVYQNLHDFKKAIGFYEKSLEINKYIGDKWGRVKGYMNLGSAYANLGDLNKAIEYCEKALKIAKEIGDMDSERIINLNTGMCYLNEPKTAYKYFRHSIELSEMVIRRLVKEEYKIPFFSRISDTYQYMIPLCLKLKKDVEAFEYVEGSKSRAFIDLIATTEIKPFVELTSELKSLLDEEEKYLAKLREIHTCHIRQVKVSVEPGESERIFEKCDEIYDKIEKFDSEYVFTRRGKPLSLDNVQNLLSSQKREEGDVVLIEYFVTKDKTFIFVISSKDKELHIETVPISEEKLNQYVEVYEKEVVDYHGELGDNWMDLSEYLIEPISKYLIESDLIYFVPYGSFHYLPMHALELNGEPLIKNHPIVYSPSASLIRFFQGKGSGKLQSCASFGVVFEEEAEDVAEVFNTNAYNGDLATKDKVYENCTNKDIIHFSCHGYFDNLDPLSSGIRLYDGVLTAREIFDMRLNTELVTLSACQTGVNRRSPGDELIGLTRAFLYAGAPSVMVSLWSVDAHSTQDLMLEFYNLLKKGTDKATALQKAQKRIMKEEKYSHPYYWAPFVLIGDWE